MDNYKMSLSTHTREEASWHPWCWAALQNRALGRGSRLRDMALMTKAETPTCILITTTVIELKPKMPIKEDNIGEMDRPSVLLWVDRA